MSPFTSKALFGLCAIAALFDISVATATPSPKVISYNFKKAYASNAQESRRLRRRQNTVSVDVDNAQIAYIINVTIGTPNPQPFSLQLDTGSADLWVPSVQSDVCTSADDACNLGAFDPTQSSSFSQTQDEVGAFQISYQDNSGVSGDYFNDTLIIGKTQVKNMTMGLATQADRALGIMGIGYSNDESGYQAGSVDRYPNAPAQLLAQGYIKTLAYSLWLNDLDSLTGSILFGGVDTAKYHGNLIVLPVQKGVNNSFTDFTVALSSVSVSNGAGQSQYSASNLALPVILDSGTTDTYLPDNIAKDIFGGVGVTNDPQLGPIVPCSLANEPATFAFGFGGSGGPSIQVSIGEFITDLVLDDGSTPQFNDGSGDVCSWGLMSAGAPDQPILLGDTFLRSAYIVYDLANNQIGLAQTNFNATGSNVVEISGSSIPGASATATALAVTETYTGHPLETNTHAKSGAQQNGGHVTPTFNLGSSAAATGKSKHSGGVALASPRMELATALTGFVLVLSVLFGSTVVMLR